MANSNLWDGGKRLTSDGVEVAIHDHPGERWVKRTGRPRHELVTAWEDADEGVIAPFVEGNAAEYERDGERNLLLVAEGGHLRTVLYADERRLVS